MTFVSRNCVRPIPVTESVLGTGAGRTTLAVTWSNSNDALHFVVVESLVEDDPEFIFPDKIRDRFDGFQFVTRPHHGSVVHALSIPTRRAGSASRNGVPRQ